jgi:hypothetical protein
MCIRTDVCMLRMLRSEAEALAAIVRDYRIDLARELSARPGAEVETVATIVKTRMDALRGYEGSPAFQARPDCATASASLSVCAFLCEGAGEGASHCPSVFLRNLVCVHWVRLTESSMSATLDARCWTLSYRPLTMLSVCRACFGGGCRRCTSWKGVRGCGPCCSASARPASLSSRTQAPTRHVCLESVRVCVCLFLSFYVVGCVCV